VEAAQVPWRPLGELFVDRGLITDAELETALAEQAATGKRLGEILVELGFVSGPDLTSVLMEQLGVEIAKEEGYGSGLWAEIKRRHKRHRPDDADYDPDEPDAEEPGGEEAEEQRSSIALVPPAAEGLAGSEELVAWPPEAEPVDEQELEEIKADYTPPADREAEPDSESETAALRAELDEARTDIVRLQEMLADAMTALAAFHAEAAREPNAAD
jgi:hypothetical protein